MKSDANIRQRIQKTNKKLKKITFLIKKSVYYPIFMPKMRYFS